MVEGVYQKWGVNMYVCESEKCRAGNACRITRSEPDGFFIFAWLTSGKARARALAAAAAAAAAATPQAAGGQQQQENAHDEAAHGPERWKKNKWNFDYSSNVFMLGILDF